LPPARHGAARLPHYEADTRLRECLIGLGYREILTIPHVREERDALFRPAGITPAHLSNPLSEEASVLRSTGAVTMAAALEWNLNHGQRNARFFEIGRHYRLHGSNPVETRVLTIGATGEAREKGLYDTARDFPLPTSKETSTPSEVWLSGLAGVTAGRPGCMRVARETLAPLPMIRFPGHLSELRANLRDASRTN